MPNLQNVERNREIVKLSQEGLDAPAVVERLEAKYPGITADAVRRVKYRARKKGDDVPQTYPGGRPPAEGEERRKVKPRKSKARKTAKRKAAPRTEKAAAEKAQKVERYTLRLPPDVGRDLRLYCAAHRRTLSDVTADALRALFKRKPPVS